LALDTDFLVAWSLVGAARHREVRALLDEEARRPGAQLALTPQVLFEFLHVVTDARRFDAPLSMEAATARVEALWQAADTIQVVNDLHVPQGVMELLRRHRLGRKRILDTVLAATLEAAGIRRLATLNPSDFAVFDFLTLVAL
jgi:predicted nucleic acid-binding protein